MNLLIVGQRDFGAFVLRRCVEAGHRVGVMTSPTGTMADTARSLELPFFSLSCPPVNVDLIVAAYCHEFLDRKFRESARLGAIGYHPSLLPIHRGRDAIAWSIRMRERVTGGTVYQMTDEVDAGDVLAQRHVFIRPDDTPGSLWRRELMPLGVDLLTEAITAMAKGIAKPMRQDPTLMTWEPSIHAGRLEQAGGPR